MKEMITVEKEVYEAVLRNSVRVNDLAQSDLLDKRVVWNVFGYEEWNEDEQRWEEWYDEDGCDIDGKCI